MIALAEAVIADHQVARRRRDPQRHAHHEVHHAAP